MYKFIYTKFSTNTTFLFVRFDNAKMDWVSCMSVCMYMCMCSVCVFLSDAQHL